MKLPLLILLLSIASSPSTHAQERAGSVLASPTGRFVLGQISSMRADQFLLDTQTGRVWRMVTDGTKVIFEPVYVQTLVGTRIPFPLTFDQELAEATRVERDRTNAAANAAAITKLYLGTNAPLQLEPAK